MSIDPAILETFLTAHKALVGNIRQLAPLPHILSFSPHKRAAFNDTIDQAHAKLDGLVSQLTSVRAEVDTILANEVRRSRAQLRSCIAPIGYLPTDVFRSIIRLVVEGRSFVERPSTVRTLLAVCTAWREAVLSDAFLFTFIDWRKWNAQLIALWRSRAGTHPFFITLDTRWKLPIAAALPGNHLKVHDVVSSPSHSPDNQPSETTVQYQQRVRAIQSAQSALLDELAAALCHSCDILHLEWDHYAALRDFESWIELRDIVLGGAKTIVLRVPWLKTSSMRLSIGAERLPSLYRLEVAFPLSFPAEPPTQLTELSLTIKGGKWAEYAASISKFQSLESLRFRFSRSCQLDSCPSISLPRLKTLELSNCWSDHFVESVFPAFHAPNVQELVLEDTEYFRKEWWRIWVETFPEVTRLVISESVRHDHPALGGIQSFTSLKRLFHKARFSALSEIHVIAEFGPGALVGLVSTIVESSPKSVNNEDQQIKRLSLSPLSQDSVSWFQEQIDKIRSMLQVLEKWCEQEGRDPYSPDSIVDWMEHALGRHQRDEYRHFLTFQHFEAGGYLRSLESWLSLSRSIEEFQVVEPDLDPNIFRAANFRQSNESTRSANVATAQQFIRETRNSLQQEVFDSGLWSQVMEIRELHRDANGTGSDFELDDDSSGGDDVDG